MKKYGVSKRTRVKYRRAFNIACFFVQELIEEFMKDRCLVISAAISYYTAFSLAPILIILLPFLGQYLTKQEIIVQVSEAVGERGASVVKTLIENAVLQPDNTLATTMSILMVILGATTTFSVLHSAFNEIWNVKTDHIKNYILLIRQRVLAFFMLILTGVLMIASVVSHTVLQYFLDNFQSVFTTLPIPVVTFINKIGSFMIFILLFGLIYRILSDAKLRWSSIWIGAGLTSFLFSLGRILIGFYLARSGVASVYGAAGSLVVLMIWFYYSAVIVLLGAELIKVYSRYQGENLFEKSSETMPRFFDDVKDREYRRNARRKKLLKNE